MFTICVEPFKVDNKIASGQMTIMDQISLTKIETLQGQRSTENYELLQEECVDTQSQHNFTLVLKTCRIG
jgi:hypothetical protein